MTTNNTTSNEAATPKKKRKRWTQNTAWYLFLPIMEQAVKDKIISKVITRDYFKKLLNEICKAAGIKREDIDIIAGVRAELYFGGTWTSVSFDAIHELAEKGTDIVFIEKEGVPEVLTEHADKYGIAMVNTRGYLTEYGKDLMTAAKKSGANVVIMTDYDLTGINIASQSPKDMPWIGVDDATLEYFNLNRESLTAEATNTRILDSVRKKVEGDERFKNVDIEFLKEQRIEIDAILAQVGDERFWEYNV
jgi:DNA topoisomerase VI subunit A